MSGAKTTGGYMTNLTKIVGVGKVKAGKLEELGYPDVESLNVLEDAVLNADPIDLKTESIDSIRELVGNEPASPPEAESTDQEPASAEASVEEQGQTSMLYEDGSEQTPEEQSGASSQEPEPEEPVLIEFQLTSGKHKNRTLMWKTSNPSAKFKDGLYVPLSTITVAKRPEQPVKGETAFNLIYGQTSNGASLPDAEYKIFFEALAKKKQPRHQGQVRLG